MANFDVLAVGELNPDLILTGLQAEAPVLGSEQTFATRKLTLGSSTAITCVLLQRLGLDTAMVARIGDDAEGRFCKDLLDAEGVETSGLIIDSETSTGITISVSYPDDRLLLTQYGTMTRLAPADVDRRLFVQARHLHVASFFIQTGLRPGLAALLVEAQAAGMTTSLDTGFDPSGAWDTGELAAVLAAADVFLPNEVELEYISGEPDRDRALDRLHALGAREIALKRGAAGTTYSGPEGRIEHAAFAVTPVDTTGAGDAFNAGYLAARLAGELPVERLALGAACGAVTAAAVGGIGGLRDLAEVREFIRFGTMAI